MLITTSDIDQFLTVTHISLDYHFSNRISAICIGWIDDNSILKYVPMEMFNMNVIAMNINYKKLTSKVNMMTLNKIKNLYCSF